MPFARFEGEPLFYAASPARAPGRLPLILVHGAGGTHFHWPPHVRGLRRCFPAVGAYAPDLPGHGASGGPPSASVEHKAAAVLALLDDLGFERAVLAGHSMGAAIGLTLALAHPQRVAGLALLGAGARLRVAPAYLDGLVTRYAETLSQIVAGLYGPNATPRARARTLAQMRAISPEVLRADWLACNAFDARERLSEVSAPALVLTGTADGMTPPRYAEFLAAHLPRAQLRLVEGAGHMVMAEQPQVVAGALARFLEEVSAS